MIELKRAVEELGLKVANIPAEVRGVYLGDVRFRPFWEAAEALGVVVFMHPDGAKNPWFFQWEMWNSLGQSLEEAKFMASVIYEGILGSRLIKSTKRGQLQGRRTPDSFWPVCRIVLRCA